MKKIMAMVFLVVWTAHAAWGQGYYRVPPQPPDQVNYYGDYAESHRQDTSAQPQIEEVWRRINRRVQALEAQARRTDAQLQSQRDAQILQSRTLAEQNSLLQRQGSSLQQLQQVQQGQGRSIKMLAVSSDNHEQRLVDHSQSLSQHFIVLLVITAAVFVAWVIATWAMVAAGRTKRLRGVLEVTRQEVGWLRQQLTEAGLISATATAPPSPAANGGRQQTPPSAQAARPARPAGPRISTHPV